MLIKSDISIYHRVMIIIFSIFLLIGVCVIFGWIYIQIKIGNNIYPYIYVDNIDLSDKSKTQAYKILNKNNDFYSNAIIEVIYQDTPIATFSGKSLSISRNTDSKIDEAHLIGRSKDIPKRISGQLNALFHFRNYNFSSRLNFNSKPILDFIQDANEKYNIEPTNALFTFQHGKVTSFKTHKNGKKLKTDKFLLEVYSLIQNLNRSTIKNQITIDDQILEPEITLGKVNTLGIEGLIGEGVSNYRNSINSRIHNIILAASKFNGLIIPKDSVFSFNANIGEISSQTGYQQAYIINRGKTELGDGGGVCQVSTTLFRAALNTGLPINERTAHAYRVSYYESDSKPGFDATIFYPNIDLKFKNDTPAAILIETEIDKVNKILKFKLYGRSDERKVVISPITIWDIKPAPPPIYQDDASLNAGIIKQIDFSASGAKVKYQYQVYERDGKIKLNNTIMSTYRPWQAIYLRGTR